MGRQLLLGGLSLGHRKNQRKLYLITDLNSYCTDRTLVETATRCPTSHYSIPESQSLSDSGYPRNIRQSSGGIARKEMDRRGGWEGRGTNLHCSRVRLWIHVTLPLWILPTIIGRQANTRLLKNAPPLAFPPRIQKETKQTTRAYLGRGRPCPAAWVKNKTSFIQPPEGGHPTRVNAIRGAKGKTAVTKPE